MAYGINGTLLRLQDPMGDSPNSLNRERNWSSSYSETHCVNSPIMHSVLWNGGLSEAQEPDPTNYDGATQKGDVINVIFDIYQCNDIYSVGTFPADWTLVSSIRKTRDVRNISEFDRVFGGDGVQTNHGHIFTADISEVCRDLLSYSLLPHGKGTYMNTFYGGLNGGAKKQDNLAEPVWSDKFIQTRNGTVRWIRVHYRTEIIDGDGIIQEAIKAGSFLSSYSQYRILNNAPDFDNNSTASVNMTPTVFVHGGWGTSTTYPRQHQSLCRNYTFASDINSGARVAKEVRMTDTSETLSWQQSQINNYGIWYSGSVNPEGIDYGPNNTSDLVADAYMEVTAYSAAGVIMRTARLYDWTLNLRPRYTTGTGVAPNTDPAINVYERKQNRACAQNVSPVYINANCIHDLSPVKDVWENGGTTYTRYRIDTDLADRDAAASLFLNDEIAYYQISGTTVTTTDGNGTGVEKNNNFERRWYEIDREREITVSTWNTGVYYRGVYYTELRSDYATNAKKIRCKGILYHQAELPFVRIHWLNKAGGIDSHTFKGDSTVSYNANKDIILRPEPNRFNWGVGRSSTANPYPSNNANLSLSYYGDTVRGADVYNGGLEVLNIDGTKSGKVSSLPLNKLKAEWLREIMHSPNVWTEVNTQDQVNNERLIYQVPYRTINDITNGSNTSGQQPNNWSYVPIIVTNASVDTFDTDKGLTNMTIEYTHAHGVVTQRN